MSVALWIVNILLAAVFLAAGGAKVVRSRSDLVSAGMAWAGEVSDAGVRMIGLVEVLGAVGLVVPMATGVAPVLTPLAAVGLALVMLAATVFHVRREEPPATTLALAGVAIASAILGFVAL